MKIKFLSLAGVISLATVLLIPGLYVHAAMCTLSKIKVDDGAVICRVRTMTKGPVIKIRQKASAIINIQTTASSGGQTIVAAEDQNINNTVIKTGDATASSTVTILMNTVIVTIGGGNASTTSTSTVEIFQE